MGETDDLERSSERLLVAAPANKINIYSTCKKVETGTKIPSTFIQLLFPEKFVAHQILQFHDAKSHLTRYVKKNKIHYWKRTIDNWFTYWWWFSICLPEGILLNVWTSPTGRRPKVSGTNRPGFGLRRLPLCGFVQPQCWTGAVHGYQHSHWQRHARVKETVWNCPVHNNLWIYIYIYNIMYNIYIYTYIYNIVSICRCTGMYILYDIQSPPPNALMIQLIWFVLLHDIIEIPPLNKQWFWIRSILAPLGRWEKNCSQAPRNGCWAFTRASISKCRCQEYIPG